MKSPGNHASPVEIVNTLAEIAHALESSKHWPERLRRVLELLGRLVPYDCCALSTGASPAAPVFVVPDTAGEKRDTLPPLLRRLLLHMTEQEEGTASTSNLEGRLDLPIIGGDRIVGLLHVEHPDRDIYGLHHIQLMSAVGSQVGAYLAMVRAEMALRESEQRNARLYQMSEDANRLKDEFLATLSHELRTPLNAILGWAHMLRTGTLNADTTHRALDSLERNAKAQAQLVEDLLDVSRIVSGKLQIKTDDVALSSVITAAVDTVRPAALAKGVDIRVSIDAETDIHVSGDADRLQQIVWNLLSNAVKFTSAGGHVEVELIQIDSEADIVVRDTGEGIPSTFLPVMFDRFRQADASVSRKHGGLGLGLTIVRYLTEAHGGSVDACSPGVGKGATFTVRLPLLVSSKRTCIEPISPDHAKAECLSRTRVLVVDDDPDARELMRVVLESNGAIVTIAHSAGEALHALKENRYDVLLADIGMPEQDGYSLIEAIRRLPADLGGHVYAVAVTAYASLRERNRALDCGYNWHLAKPVDPDQLVAVVARRRTAASVDVLKSARRSEQPHEH